MCLMCLLLVVVGAHRSTKLSYLVVELCERGRLDKVGQTDSTHSLTHSLTDNQTGRQTQV